MSSMVLTILGLAGSAAASMRSEERRGGEEGRIRWAPDHLKKKKKHTGETTSATRRAGASEKRTNRGHPQTVARCSNCSGSDTLCTKHVRPTQARAPTLRMQDH